MFLKSFLVITICAFVARAHNPWGDEFENDYGLRVPKKCNETFCRAPCEGAAAPPTCPPNMPDCPSGCACTMDCATNTQTCFMTFHCTKIRRFFTKPRHVRALSQSFNHSTSTDGTDINTETNTDLEPDSTVMVNDLTHTFNHEFPVFIDVVDDMNATRDQDVSESTEINLEISTDLTELVTQENQFSENEELTQSTKSDLTSLLDININEIEKETVADSRILAGRVERDLPETTDPNIKEEDGTSEAVLSESTLLNPKIQIQNNTKTEDKKNLKNEHNTHILDVSNNRTNASVLRGDGNAQTSDKTMRNSVAGMTITLNGNKVALMIFFVFSKYLTFL